MMNYVLVFENQKITLYANKKGYSVNVPKK